MNRGMPGCVAGAILKVLAKVDHGSTFEKPGLLGADGVHLTKRGKRVFANKLARLTRRALN